MVNKSSPKALYSLTLATRNEALQLQSWFHSQEELIQWGGPGLVYGLSGDAFLSQIKFDSLQSYSLKNNQNELVGFGQFYIRLGKHHFGRLAIASNFRGQGLAGVLLQRLMEQAQNTQKANGFSLFVLKGNQPAFKTYIKAGFEVTEYPESIPGGFDDCLYMTKAN